MIIVQEKLDGSCCAVALANGAIVALGRAGWLADTSPYEQHRMFAHWVRQNEQRFRSVLGEGERIVGEWLSQAHSTRYALRHEPFVVFDLMIGATRLPFATFNERIDGRFPTPYVLRRCFEIRNNSISRPFATCYHMRVPEELGASCVPTWS
jgi:hypothetical protein